MNNYFLPILLIMLTITSIAFPMDLEIDHEEQGNRTSFAQLSTAITGGDAQAVEALIKAGADVNSYNRHGMSPLHVAAKYGHGKIIQLLIAAGAYKNRCTEDNNTPLALAAAARHLSAIQILLDAGASVTVTDNYGCYPFNVACQEGFKLFVAHMAKLKNNEAYKDAALIRAIKTDDRESVIAILSTLNKNMSPEAVEMCIIHGMHEMIPVLLDQGAPLVQDYVNLALKWGAFNVLTILSTYGLVPDGDDLTIAAIYGYTAIVTMIFKESNPTFDQKRKAFLASIAKGNAEMVKLFLRLPVLRHSAVISDGLVHLHKCPTDSCIAVGTVLLEYADMLTQDSKDQALSYAVERGMAPLVAMLIQAGANSNTFDVCSRAAESNNRAVVKCILRDPKFNKDESSALSYVLRGLTQKNVRAAHLLFRAELPITAHQGNYSSEILTRVSALQDLPVFLSIISGKHPQYLIDRVRTIDSDKTFWRCPSTLGQAAFNSYMADPLACVNAFLDRLIACPSHAPQNKPCAGYTRTQGVGQTVLMWACMLGHTDKVKQLLERAHAPFYLNAQDTYGTTALIYAVMCGHTEVVKLLLAQQSIRKQINKRCIKGFTALDYALVDAEPIMLITLLENGAQINCSTIRHASDQGDHVLAAQLLIELVSKQKERNLKRRPLLRLIAPD